jgi:hypothetical protein
VLGAEHQLEVGEQLLKNRDRLRHASGGLVGEREVVAGGERVAGARARELSVRGPWPDCERRGAGPSWRADLSGSRSRSVGRSGCCRYPGPCPLSQRATHSKLVL